MMSQKTILLVDIHLSKSIFDRLLKLEKTNDQLYSFLNNPENKYVRGIRLPSSNPDSQGQVLDTTINMMIEADTKSLKKRNSIFLYVLDEIKQSEFLNRYLDLDILSEVTSRSIVRISEGSTDKYKYFASIEHDNSTEGIIVIIENRGVIEGE